MCLWLEKRSKFFNRIDVGTCLDNCSNVIRDLYSLQNCSSLQIYNESQCACVCTNLESQQLCEEDRNKIWDKINCSCKCVNAEPCTTGLKLNLNTCRWVINTFLKNQSYYKRCNTYIMNFL